jgi:hypothetical protein
MAHRMDDVPASHGQAGPGSGDGAIPHGIIPSSFFDPKSRPRHCPYDDIHSDPSKQQLQGVHDMKPLSKIQGRDKGEHNPASDVAHRRKEDKGKAERPRQNGSKPDYGLDGGIDEFDDGTKDPIDPPKSP